MIHVENKKTGMFWKIRKILELETESLLKTEKIVVIVCVCIYVINI